MYRIGQIKLKVSDNENFQVKKDEEQIKEKLEKMLSVGKSKVTIDKISIVRKSVDARQKPEIFKVYTVDFDTKSELSKKVIEKCSITKSENIKYTLPESGYEALINRPVVVGFGPAGMFAALILAEKGYKPLVFERGEDTAARVKSVERFIQTGELNPQSNVQFGEGGAGTFSDGKLNTQIKDKRIRKVLETFVECGAPEDILYSAKPHIGTDVLRRVVVNLRKKIERLGGTVNFNSTFMDFDLEEKDGVSSLKSIVINGEKLDCNVMLMALGHSARDTMFMLKKRGVNMQQKAFSIGVRVEHAQKLIDDAQHGKTYEELGAADYKLSYHCKESKRGVYSFCMCPGGEVIVASSEKGAIVTNGMSKRARKSGFANSGILVDVRPSDFESEDVLAGVAFQRKYEKKAFEQAGYSYEAPSCTLKEFKENTEKGRAVRACLPEFAVDAILEAFPEFGKKIKGFDGDDTKLIAVETRSSSPIRIIRNENFESSIKGIYPVGEGAGYAGGITSSATDGIRVAEAIISKYGGQQIEDVQSE